jgi:hypothetical protein
LSVAQQPYQFVSAVTLGCVFQEIVEFVAAGDSLLVGLEAIVGAKFPTIEGLT